MIVVGFVVFVVITLLSVAIFYTSAARDRLRSSQLANFANKLVTSAESVYFAGEPSKVTITAYLPEGVESFSIQDNSFVFDLTTDSGLTTIAFPCDAPLNPSITLLALNAGVRKFKIEAQGNQVNIDEVS